MTKDMTRGNPLKLIIGFSIPLVLGNLFQQFYNIVDSIIVGKALGLEELTAVGATTSVSFLIIGFVSGLCGGFAIPVAQRFGAKDYGGMRKYIANTVYTGTAMALILTVITTLLCGKILTWMHTPESIFANSYGYFFIICLGIPFTVLYNCVSGIIRAMGDSKTPFYFLVLSAFLNIGLDLLFVIPLKAGVAGAAWATIISQGISGLLCLIFLYKKYDIVKFKGDDKKPDFVCIKHLLGTGVPMGLQFSITAIGSIMLQSAVNILGDLYVSAYAAALKIKSLFLSPFDGFGSACATYCAQNYGAGNLPRIRKGFASTMLIAWIYAIAAGIFLVLDGSVISLLFVDAEETAVITEIQRFLTCTGPFYGLLGTLICTRMTTQGLGYSKTAMFAGVLELVARGAMATFVIPAFGYIAVCFTDQTAWGVATLFLGILMLYILRKIKREFAKDNTYTSRNR